MTRSVSRADRATFPDHEGLVIEKGNHFPMAEDPEPFVSTLGDWWQRKPAERRVL